MKFKGIGASDGVAIAKTFLLIEEEIVIPTSAKSHAEESKNLKNAVTASVADLEKLKANVLKTMGAEKAEIFEAHIQLATDPVMHDEMEAEIKSNKNAAEAVNDVMNKYFDTFKAMEDAYMKERAADVKDVYTRVIRHILGIEVPDLTAINEEVIIVAHDITPSHTAQLNKKFVKGFLTDIGGRTSHAAIMARSLEIPAILGLKNITTSVKNHDSIGMDGASGVVIINPTSEDIKHLNEEAKRNEELKIKQKTYIGKPSVTQDGHKVVLEGNIGNVKDAIKVQSSDGEGVGLFRSEFLYMDSTDWPTEEEQYNAYKDVMEALPNKEVVVRTLDIGGDKHLNYFTFPEEMNPFLGYRAIRLCLDKTEIFKTQLRALIRASAHGKVAIMFPMIAIVDEFIRAKAIFNECYEEVKKHHKVANHIDVGMMVEIPAAAVMAEEFAKHADFFSIGTNDLIQYSHAADRMSQSVAYLYQPLNPAILKLIKMTIDGGHKHKRWVAMCGEMAGDQDAIPILVGLGLDKFSMSASSILKSRMLLDQLSYEKCKHLAEKVVSLESDTQVLAEVQKLLKNK